MPTAASPINRRRFLAAVAAAAALVLSAPFLGQARSVLRAAFPGWFVWLVAGMVAAGVLAAVAAAAMAIRGSRAAAAGQGGSHGMLRWTAIGFALLIAAAYARSTASGNRDSDVVELFHFLQYGVVTLLFYRACRPSGDWSMLVLPLLAGVVVGAAEEWFQWFLPARVGEIRDLYLNLTAITCGLLFSLAIDPPAGFTPSLRPGSARRVARFAAVAILALAAFVQAIHIGHGIADDEIGVFESRYSRSRLMAMQEEKGSRWRNEPPPLRLRRLSREDQYLTEAVQHAQQRNRLWEAGDAFGAWSENRILEKYYAPVLAARTYAAPGGVRWPDAQRNDAGARAATQRAANPAAVFVSGAYPYPIFAWRPVAFWTIVLAAAGLVLVIGSAAERRAARRAGAMHPVP